MAKHATPFTEAGSDQEQPTRAKRGSRRGRKLLITDCGPDFSDFTEEEKTELLASLASDDELAGTVSALRDAERAAIPAQIEDKHIEWFLALIERAERFFIPKLIKRKAKAQGIEFTIDPDVAAHTLAFTAEDKKKLCPLGAEAANRHLPDKIKKMIAAVGPGSEFLGELLVALQAQQMRCLAAQGQKNAQRKPPQTNGQRGPQPGRSANAPGNSRPQVPPTIKPFVPGATEQAEAKPEIKPIGIKEQTA